jgi:hypothetical protein
MQGTIVCGVTDTDEGRQALATAVELAERLRLRLCSRTSPRASVPSTATPTAARA